MAQEAPIQYSLTFREADHHVVHVEASVPTDGQPTTDLTMPVWTPGSYLVREYARQVEDVEAIDARTANKLAIAKTNKNTWRVQNNGATEIQVRYRLYCREMGVRTNWVESSWALLNGAPTFMTRADALHRKHLVRIESLPNWPNVATSLAAVDANDPWQRQAANFDELVDSPILLGKLDDRVFEVGGKKHHLVTVGADHLWDTAKAAKDAATIVATEHEFWGDVPYQEYWFLNVVSESGGGLEHDNSCVLMTSRWAMRKRDSYTGWLALVSHEFFHAWNIRRLRPKELMQYNYDAEQYFGELWIAEGLTSYYDDLFVARARLCSRDEYLGLLSKNLTAVQPLPGRTIQSLYDSSWDTWIKFYRPDENSNNSRVNYYSKGALVGLLLDVEIQRATNGEKDLGHVMRRLWNEHRTTGYTNDDFRRIASEVAGVDLANWFHSKVNSTDELDFTPVLDWYGLRFKGDNGKKADGDKPATGNGSSDKSKADGDKSKKEIWLGWEAAATDGRLIVKRVQRGSPADEAGVNVDDELIALDGYRVSADSIGDRVGLYQPGEKLKLLIARRGKLVETIIELGTKPTPSWQLEVLPDATPEQKARLAKWLNLPPEEKKDEPKADVPAGK